jgi:hypothetical protein
VNNDLKGHCLVSMSDWDEDGNNSADDRVCEQFLLIATKG